MLKHPLTYLAAAVLAGGLANGPARLSAADDAVGVVQISDAGSPGLVSNGTPATTVSSSSEFFPGGYISGYPQYGFGSCRSGCPTNPWPGSKWLFRPGSCTHSPDHGWAPPGSNPIRRAGVEYRAFWPHEWYGMHSGKAVAGGKTYPVIPLPTDTTQLGYYYQQVPRWRANLAMIPPAPVPAHFHDRTSSAYGSAYGCPTTGSEWIPTGHSEVEFAPIESGVEPSVPPAPPALEVDSARRASYQPARF